MIASTQISQIIDHFTSDANLKSKILQKIAANKGRTPSLATMLSGFPIDAGLQSRIADFVSKARNGHDIDAVAGYFVNDRAAHEQLRDNVAFHTGSVRSILKS
jgi:hypothetical protein